MPYVPPTLSSIRDDIVVPAIESRTSQKVPSHDRSFKRVIANVLSLVIYPFYRFVSSERKQCFSISADEESLENFHGPGEGLSRGGATKCKVEVDLSVSGDADIKKTAVFENTATGLYYFPVIDYAVSESDYTIALIADDYGEEYTLDVGDELELQSSIENISSVCTVSAITIEPEDEEDLEDFRDRIIYSHSGSSVPEGTAYQYKIWAESVDGVYRAFPFSGRPDDIENALPGDRSIFVESKYNDGIPTDTILDNVTTEIKSHESLGNTDATLFVSSVEKVYFTVNIYDLDTEDAQEASVKSAIVSSVSSYLNNARPYVFGVDTEYGRSDKISAASIGTIVYNIVNQYGSGITKVVVEETGIGSITSRTLVGGEIARLTTPIVYVES